MKRFRFVLSRLIPWAMKAKTNRIANSNALIAWAEPCDHTAKSKPKKEAGTLNTGAITSSPFAPKVSAKNPARKDNSSARLETQVHFAILEKAWDINSDQQKNKTTAEFYTFLDFPIL